MSRIDLPLFLGKLAKNQNNRYNQARNQSNRLVTGHASFRFHAASPLQNVGEKAEKMFTGKLTIRHLLWATALLAVYCSALAAALRGNLIGWGIVVTIPFAVLILVAYAIVYWVSYGVARIVFRTGIEPQTDRIRASAPITDRTFRPVSNPRGQDTQDCGDTPTAVEADNSTTRPVGTGDGSNPLTGGVDV